MGPANSQEGEGSINVHISDSNRVSDASYTQTITIFEPENNNNGRRESNVDHAVHQPAGPPTPAPEKKLTLFALRLAILEKTATMLGTLGFVWATVVLLGGFAVTLDTTDFWIVTVILVTEGTRIFSRSHELEWQRQSTWSVSGAGINSFRHLKVSPGKFWTVLKSILRSPNLNGGRIYGSRDQRLRMWETSRLPTRRWASSDVPILPYFSWLFLSRNISKILQYLQFIAAIACVVLSLLKLTWRNFGVIEKGDTDKSNRKAALCMFYGLSLAEASMFLIEKIYWESKVIYCKLLEKVNEECGFEPTGIISVRRFFYNAYSKCVEGSVFDGLKMDMVSFSIELLGSNSPDEQLMGARILRSFAMNKRFSDDTLQKIGVTFSAVERLVEILNWKDTHEEEIRRAAAEILSKLAGKKQNSLRVAGISGALESISSLLYVNRISSPEIDEIGEKSVSITDHQNYGFWTFNHLGLAILKKLARDHDNCWKIGNTRGLLPKIIDFTCASEKLLKDKNVATSQIQTVKKSLQLIKMLAGTTGNTGKQLRKEISEIIFTFSNIRDILRHGENYPDMQKLGIEILTSLAMEDDATDRIGGTGGILKELLNIFFKEGMPKEHVHVRTAAGEALVMLVMGSEQNCNFILKLGVMEKLVRALEVPSVCLNAARVLRNLCTYSHEECFVDGVTKAIPTVLKGMISNDEKLQEVMVGLAARAFKYIITQSESRVMFERAGIMESEIARTLVRILQKHRNPPTRFPRIRRFTIELAIWMMRDNETNIAIFKDLGLEFELQNVLETTSELECFNIFSGTVGLNRFRTPMHALVETAQNLLSIERKLENSPN